MSEDVPVTDAEALSYYARPDEVARPWTPPVRETRKEMVRRHLEGFLPPVLVLPLCGAPVALLWRALTPHVGIMATDAGPQPIAGESNQFFAIDGWFVLVTLLAGLVLGAIAWAALRRRSGATPAGIAVGGLLAAAVTNVAGSRMVVDRYLYGFCTRPKVECTVYDGTLHLRAMGALVVWPVAMLVTYAAFTLFRDRDR